MLDNLLGDVLAHVVIDAAAREDDLAVVAKLLGTVCQVVGIDANTVTADEARPEVQEVPLRPCGLEHFERVDPHLVEDDGELVHEGDVDVALGVLDDLSSLRHFNAAGAMDTGLDDNAIDARDGVQRLLVAARDDLLDRGEAVDLVTGVDALRAIANLEVDTALQTGFLLQDRYTDLLGHAGVDGRLVDDDAARGQVSAHRGARRGNRGEVRGRILVDRCRDSDDDELRLLEAGRVAGPVDARVPDGFVADLERRVKAVLVCVDLGLVDVVTDDVAVLGEFNRNRHAYIAEPHKGDFLFVVQHVLIQSHLVLPFYTFS